MGSQVSAELDYAGNVVPTGTIKRFSTGIQATRNVIRGRGINDGDNKKNIPFLNYHILLS
jgi:hypothetical protein